MKSFGAQIASDTLSHPADRRAALAVHAMDPTDRDWLLAQLSRHERAALEPLLAELGAMGLPAGAWLGSLLSIQHHAVEEATLVHQVEGLEGAVVAAILATEPDRLAAHVIGLCPWPWRDDVLTRIESERRTTIERLLGLRGGLERVDLLCSDVDLGTLDCMVLSQLLAHASSALETTSSKPQALSKTGPRMDLPRKLAAMWRRWTH